MASLADAFIRVRADTDGFTRDVNGRLRNAEGQFVASGKRSGKGFSSGLSGALGGLAGKVFAPLAAAATGAGLVNMFSGFISEAREAERVGALTAQVIKTTGGAAKITAGQVSDLATAISNKTGIDDEAIQSASNLLLTFTNVRNEVGKGNDIFNQATQAAIDMSTVLGTDAKSASIQLGKALNDPIKGITALSRAGVSFTEQQKAQIKTLVESGDTLGAQKIILAELGKEFGGAAEAAATPMDKLRTKVGNLKEAIGTALLPVIDRFATFMIDKGIPALENFGGKAKAAFDDFAAGVRGTGDGKGTLEAIGTIITTKVVPALRAFGEWFMSTGLPAIKSYLGYWRDTVIPVIARIYEQVFPAAVDAFNKVRTAIEENKPQLQQLFEKFKQVADFIVTRVMPVLGPILAGTLQGMGDGIRLAITILGFMVDAFNKLRSTVATVLGAILSIFVTFVGNFLNGAVRAFGWVPEIGDKLRGAQASFQTFARVAQAAIDSMHGKDIYVNAYLNNRVATGNYGGGGITKAHGGPVRGGLPYIVGEEGPEWFIPKTSGTILPNGTNPATAGTSDSLTVVVNNPLPERVSESIPKALRRRQHVLGMT